MPKKNRAKKVVLDSQQVRTEVHRLIPNNRSIGNLVLCRYSIEDAEANYRIAPETFAVPSARERANVAVGEHAQLSFRLEVGTVRVVERMWVKVLHRQGETYIGRLSNEPGTITTLRLGDVMRFTPRNVIKITSATACANVVLGATNIRDVPPHVNCLHSV